MKEFIIFVCTDSTEVFFSKLRSAGLNYNLPSFFTALTVRGVSYKHCLLTFFIISIFQLCITINNIEQVRKSLSLIPETLQFNEIQTAIDNSNLPNKPKVDLMKILKDSDANMVGKIKQVVDRVADKVIFPDIILQLTVIDNSYLLNKRLVDLMKIPKDSEAHMVGKLTESLITIIR